MPPEIQKITKKVQFDFSMLQCDGNSLLPKERRSVSFNDCFIFRNRIRDLAGVLHQPNDADQIEPKVTKKRKDVDGDIYIENLDIPLHIGGNKIME